ncbi:helix-turn-helix domain-containing protein [Candidatus Latescibacterota bacterium]
MPPKSDDICNLFVCLRIEMKHVFFEFLDKMDCDVQELTSLEDLSNRADDSQLIFLEYAKISPDMPPKPYMINFPDNISVENKSLIKIITNKILTETKGIPELFSRKYGYLTLGEVEKIHIINTLNRCDWNCKTSAKQLGINRTTLYRKMKKYGITRKK